MTEIAYNERNPMGYRERIKKAASLQEAKFLLEDARRVVSEKAYRRCLRAFEQLPFTKAAP
jgi:hypothetical protein